jgi:hypothetical protein
MGTEKQFTRSIMALILDVGRKDMGNGLDFNKGTPNHRALAVACGYGWSLKFGDAAQKKTARDRIEMLFQFQNDGGHYTWAETNECLTASHYNWWGTALAALRWFAHKEGDPRVLELTGTWWRQEIALLSLLSVPSGKLAGSIVAPGGRTVFDKNHPESGGSVPRDVVYRLIMGLKTNKKDAWFKSAVEPLSYYKNKDEKPDKDGRPFLDITAPWIVRDLIKSGDDFAGARKAGKDALDGDHSNLPKLVDRLHIVRTPEGHVAWFDDLTGTKGEPPQFWALCNYGTGEQDYGLDRPSPLPPPPPGGFEGRPRIEV